MTSGRSQVTLEAGEYYYMEVYHVNNGGNGHFRISVETPNTDQSLNWHTHEVTSVSTSLTVDPEEFTYTMDGATGGYYKLRIVRYENFEITYDVEETLDYNASPAEM